MAKEIKVLIVEDEPDVRLYLQTILENVGFSVQTATNGKQALDRLTECKPDIISLDLVMPKMSGIKFFNYIQKNKDRKDIPVVVVTAHAHDEMGEKDLEQIKSYHKKLGNTLFVIEKPVKPDVYLNTLGKALGLKDDELVKKGEAEALRIELAEKIKTTDKAKLKALLKVLEA